MVREVLLEKVLGLCGVPSGDRTTGGMTSDFKGAGTQEGLYIQGPLRLWWKGTKEDSQMSTGLVTSF